MRRLLGKLIPRSTGGRWAAGLGVAGVIAVGIYLVFFVFAFHLIFVDEVVDEEAPEFAVEVDIDELISDALETGPVATTAAAAAAGSDDLPTDQSMSVGEHESDGTAESGDSAGDAGSGETDAADAGSESEATAESDGTSGSDGSTGSAESGDAAQAAEPDQTVDEAEEQGVRVAYVGSFGPRSHPAEGTAVVLTDGTQTFLRFDDDFATDNGPDLNV